MTATPIHRVDEADGTWVRLQLDAPPGHVLSLAVVRALHAAISGVEGAHVRWLTIEGSDGQFSYGASIPEHLPEAMPEVLPAAHALMRALLDAPVPTAALVEGRCLGGGFELALCCDDILAAHDATFGLPEIRLGAFPPLAAALLPVRVGASRASRAVLTGGLQPAAYWHDAGLVSLVSPATSVIEAARAWFQQQLAPHSAIALSHAAQAARAGWRPAVDQALAANEARYLQQLLRTHDAVEGVRAWLEKRPPRWQDR